MQLYQLAKMIRSKNAGPFEISLDILFEDKETYDKVVKSGKVTKETVAALYHIPVETMQYYELPLAYALKFSFIREYPSGDFHDTDIYGCQMHAPLIYLDIPLAQ